MNKTLLKKMAREVSVETLTGILLDYAKSIEGHAEITAEVEETLSTLEELIAELKRRGNGPRPERKRNPKPEQPPAPETNEGANRPAPLIGNGGARHEQIR